MRRVQRQRRAVLAYRTLKVALLAQRIPSRVVLVRRRPLLPLLRRPLLGGGGGGLAAAAAAATQRRGDLKRHRAAAGVLQADAGQAGVHRGQPAGGVVAIRRLPGRHCGVAGLLLLRPLRGVHANRHLHTSRPLLLRLLLLL